jgi:division protein CdvB (Snf7/Vps24/ESCRT-III family)
MTDETSLASLAQQYREQATPEPEATDVVMDKAEVDLQIDTHVYEAALARAESKDQAVAAVTRAIIFTAAALVKPDPAYRSELSRPPLREYRSREDRSRLRFKLPKIDYAVAQKAIRQSGQSISAVVEQGLRAYALTGEIPTEVPTSE